MSNLKQKMSEKIMQENSDQVEVVVSNGISSNDSLEGTTKGEIATFAVVPDFAITLNEAKQRMAMLQAFVRDFLIPGQDYGVMPGNPKACLLKSGAEKLSDVFGFSKHVQVVNRVEDFEKGFFAYEILVSLINKRNGLVEAQGVGSCNSKEKRYRNQDPYSIANTVLKMAKKRAFIDAILSATRTSGLFTQDMENVVVEYNVTTEARNNTTKTVPKTSTSASKGNEEAMVSKSQLQALHSVAACKGIAPEEAKAMLYHRYGVRESKELTALQSADFLTYLIEYKRR